MGLLDCSSEGTYFATPIGQLLDVRADFRWHNIDCVVNSDLHVGRAPREQTASIALGGTTKEERRSDLCRLDYHVC